MFFVLSKILSIFISPLFWLVISLLLWIFLKNKLWKKRCRLIFIVLFFLFNNSFIVLQLHRVWEIDGIKISEVKDDYEVAVVLGGMAEYNNDLERISIRRGADRIWNAMRLYHLGKVKKILISGSDGFLIDRGLNEARAFREDLITFGIPEEDILMEADSKNTYENAYMTKRLLDESGITGKIILITSAIHMRRAAACFRKQDIDFDIFTTDHNTGEFYFDLTQILIPNPSAIGLWKKFFHEVSGYCIYKLMGYV